MTPLRAIRKVCIACVGNAYEVKDCGGEKCFGGQGDEKGICIFYNYRIGKGRPSVKLLRRFCLECMSGSSQSVAGCQSLNCSVGEYRFGKNPKRTGIGQKCSAPYREIANTARESHFRPSCIVGVR